MNWKSKINIHICFIVIFYSNLSPVFCQTNVSYYKQAQELYKKGPSKAPEIIELLNKEININPQNIDAVKLLGITYYGIKEFEKAIKQFDKAIAMGEEKGSIYPRILLQKAKALYYLGKFESAKKILDVYWAFFQDSEDKKQEYNDIYNALSKKIDINSNNRSSE